MHQRLISLVLLIKDFAKKKKKDIIDNVVDGIQAIVLKR